eukprot:16291361-Heterocapsa_arctica.AAC.2
MPNVWHYEDPQGYFHSVICKRLDDRAQRVWWDHTHKAQVNQPRKPGEDDPTPDGGGVVAGGGPYPPPTAGGATRPQAPNPLIGKPLTRRELGVARTNCPTNKAGVMKCWEHSCHLECSMKASECTRSHELIGNLPPLHWTVQAQLLRRGGLKC